MIHSIISDFFTVYAPGKFFHWVLIFNLHLNDEVLCKYFLLILSTLIFFAHLHWFIFFILIVFLQGRRNRKLFWLPAISPLVSVVLSTLMVNLTRADQHGVKIIKHVEGGLNPSSVKQLEFSGPLVGEAAKIGLISAIISLTVSQAKFRNIITMILLYCLL